MFNFDFPFSFNFHSIGLTMQATLCIEVHVCVKSTSQLETSVTERIYEQATHPPIYMLMCTIYICIRVGKKTNVLLFASYSEKSFNRHLFERL